MLVRRRRCVACALGLSPEAAPGYHESLDVVAHPTMFHLHENELVSREEQFDIGFVAVKAYDTSWAATFIDKFVKPDGYIVSSQNTWTDPAMAQVRVLIERLSEEKKAKDAAKGHSRTSTASARPAP